jgi:limonene-1,2-epoxide hydrolase
MASTTPGAANDAMIREFIHAWERRDTDHIVASFTDDAVYHNISLEPLVGKAAIRDFVARYEDVPPGRFEIRHQLASGNVVLNERIDHMTVDGRVIDLPICGVFEIRDGHIARWTDYYDSAAFRSE